MIGASLLLTKISDTNLKEDSRGVKKSLRDNGSVQPANKFTAVLEGHGVGTF
jgi:hypothetical protein